MSYILLTWLLAPLWWPLAALRRWRQPHPRRILLIEIAGIGDVVCSSAVFRAMRQQLGQVRIDLMVEPFVADLVAADPHLDEVVGFSSKRLRGLSGRLALMRIFRTYDTVICLNPGAALLTAMCWAGLPRRFSVLPDVQKISYTLLAPLLSGVRAHRRGYPFVQTQLDLLQAFGVVGTDRRKEIIVTAPAQARMQSLIPAVPGTKLIGIAVGSGLALKAIPEPTLSRVIGHFLRRADIRIVMIGGARDSAIAACLAAAHPDPRLINTADAVALADQPALLATLALFIGVDSGITHIADALRIPMVCLPGPAAVEEQGPDGPDVILLGRKPPCAPCSRVFVTPDRCVIGTRECVSAVGAEEIIAAAESLLTGRAAEDTAPQAAGDDTGSVATRTSHPSGP